MKVLFNFADQQTQSNKAKILKTTKTHNNKKCF